MTYARPTRHFPHRLQLLSRNVIVARRCSTSGPTPFIGVSDFKPRNNAPTPRLRHFFGPSRSGIVFPSAIISAVSSTFIPAPNKGNHQMRNTATASFSAGHAASISNCGNGTFAALVNRAEGYSL